MNRSSLQRYAIRYVKIHFFSQNCLWLKKRQSPNTIGLPSFWAGPGPLVAHPWPIGPVQSITDASLLSQCVLSRPQRLLSGPHYRLSGLGPAGVVWSRSSPLITSRCAARRQPIVRRLPPLPSSRNLGAELPPARHLYQWREAAAGHGRSAPAPAPASDTAQEPPPLTARNHHRGKEKKARRPIDSGSESDDCQRRTNTNVIFFGSASLQNIHVLKERGLDSDNETWWRCKK